MVGESSDVVDYIQGREADTDTGDSECEHISDENVEARTVSDWT